MSIVKVNNLFVKPNMMVTEATERAIWSAINDPGYIENDPGYIEIDPGYREIEPAYKMRPN